MVLGKKRVAIPLSIVMLVSSIFIFNQHVYAAIYNFTQTSWVGGYTANTATHASNQDGWTQFATSTGVMVGTNVQLSTASYTFTDDGATSTSPSVAAGGGGFANGTSASTVSSGSGAGASITLSATVVPITPPTVSTSTMGANTQSKGVAFDSFTNSVWVASTGTNNVTKLNASTGALIGTYAVGTGPRSIAFDPVTNSIWVANASSNNVTKLNASTGALIGTYAVGSVPYGVTFDSATNSIWVVNLGSANVSKLDAATGATIGTYTTGTSPVSIVFDPSTNSIWTGNNGSSDVTKLNASTGALIGTYAVFSGSRPQEESIAFDSSTNSIWVGVSYSVIAKINASTGALIGQYSVGTGMTGVFGVAFDPITNSIWVANANSSNILRFNTATGALIATYGTSAVPQGVAFDSSTNSIWVVNTASVVTKMHIASLSYATSGSFTSAVIDLGAKATSGTIAYGAGTTLPTGTAANFDVRAGNTATPDGTWGAWTLGVASGGNVDVVAGNRYAQYRINLSTTDTAVSPTIDQVTIGFSQYQANGSLTSSSFDSSSPTNLITKVTWTETATSSSEMVKLQLRSSPDGVTWSAWCGYADVGATCTGTDFFTDTVGGSNGVAIQAGSPLLSGANDRYIQYKATLVSGGGVTPVLTGVVVQYVVNTPPQFNPNYPATGNGGVSATQNANGVVAINYSVRDSDTNTGSMTPGFITPSFQYSLDGGSSWAAIATSSLAVTDSVNKSVDTAAYTTYSATWTASSSIPSTYSVNVKIKVVANDNEVANNTASATSAAFTLDTKVPVLGALPLVVDASQTTPLVTLSATDDSTLQMKVGKRTDLSDAVSEPYAATKTLPLSSGDTVYAQFTDARGNSTSIVSVSPPQAPSGVFYQDTSNVTTSEWREFFAWGVVNNPTPGFKRYNVFRSVDGGGFTLLTTITNRAVNYYVDTGLLPASSYSYQISSEDLNGNISLFSPFTPVHAPNGVGGSDLAAPTLSTVAASSITTTGATITWVTNKLSNSTVYYAATTTYPGTSKTQYASSSGVPSMVTGNSVVLSGLTPGTQYFFLPESVDSSNNVGQSANSLYTFTTLPGPVISNVTTSQIFDTQAVISWNTNVPADSSVVYSTDATFASSTQISGLLSPVTNHSVAVTGLTRGTSYYYYVKSADAAANIATDKNVVSGLVNYYYLHTTFDTAPPLISGTATSLIGETGATIAWITDKEATSWVDWGPTAALGTSTPETSVYSTGHSVTLNGLISNKKYYYRVNSNSRSRIMATDDNGGNQYSFTTLTPSTTLVGGSTIDNRDLTVPLISSVKVESVGDTTATISFVTSKIANGRIKYGDTGAYDQEAGRKDLFATAHVVSLTNLVPKTAYYFKAAAADMYANEGISSNGTFTTTGNKSVATTVTTNSVRDAAQGTSKDVALIERIKNASSIVIGDILSALSANPNLAAVSEGALASSFSDIARKVVSSPVISGTDVAVEVNAHSASIEWNTDKNANSLIAYATASEYGKGEEPYTITAGFPDEKASHHKILLDNLLPSTTYHFQVKSVSILGPASVSPDKTFTTASLLPEVTDARFDTIGESNVVVRWKTALPTKTLLEIKNTKTGEKKTIEDQSFIKEHTSTVGNLDFSTPYVLSLTATDSDGNVSSSFAMPFTTTLSEGDPIISGVKISTSLISARVQMAQTIVSWKTDKPATSKVYFGAGGSTDLNQSVPVDTNLTRDHVVITTALMPGMVYKIRVESGDSGGNATTSPPYTVLTPTTQGSVIDIISNNLNGMFGFLGGKK